MPRHPTARRTPAVAQREKTETAVETVSVSQSVTLMKNLVRAAISSVAYLRNLFPEDCFCEKKLTGVNIKMLLSRCAQSRQLVEWMENGIFDALEQKYLDTMIFAVYTEAPDTEQPVLLECYTFNFSYPDEEQDGYKINITSKTGGDEKKATVQTKVEIKNATVQLIRTLVTLVQTLKALPAERWFTLKLLYRDEITPADYEPKYFRPAAEEDAMVFTSQPYKIKLGSVNTPYHSLALQLKTVTDSFGEDGEGVDGKAASSGVVYPAEEDETDADAMSTAAATAAAIAAAVGHMPGTPDTVVLRPANDDSTETKAASGPAPMNTTEDESPHHEPDDEPSRDLSQDEQSESAYLVRAREELRRQPGLRSQPARLQHLQRTFPEVALAALREILLKLDEEQRLAQLAAVQPAASASSSGSTRQPTPALRPLASASAAAAFAMPPPPVPHSRTPARNPAGNKGKSAAASQQQHGSSSGSSNEDSYDAFRKMVLATRTVAIKTLAQSYPEATVRVYLDRMAVEGIVQRKKRGGYTLIATPNRLPLTAATGADEPVEPSSVPMEDENTEPQRRNVVEDSLPPGDIATTVLEASQSPVGYERMHRSGRKSAAEFKQLQAGTSSRSSSSVPFNSPPSISRKRKLAAMEDESRAQLPPAVQKAIAEEQLECSQQSELGDLNTSQATVPAGYGVRKR